MNSGGERVRQQGLWSRVSILWVLTGMLSMGFTIPANAGPFEEGTFSSTPESPVYITVSPTSSATGSHSVSWGISPTSGVTIYELEQRIGSGSWVNRFSGYQAGIPVTFNSLQAGSYKYRARACKPLLPPINVCSNWQISGAVTVAAPPVLSGLNAPTNDNNGAYTVSWNTSTGATSYQLQRQTNSGSWSTTQNTSAVSKAESGLGNATYGYRVRACSAAGCSAYSAVDSTNVAITPGMPSSISTPGTSYSGSYTVSWGAASGSITKYDLNKQFNGSWSTGYDGLNRSKPFTNLPIGTYKYAVRACKTTGSYTSCSGWRYSGTTNVIELANITSPPSEVTSSLAVGTLPMGLDVAANGDAVASVPLQLIPGVAGFQPSLGLVYSSGRAIDRAERSLPEDTIGYGWRLSGLSQIRRCVVGKSSSASIGLNSSDSLCLDGMPLVRVSGTHLAAGASYRTMIESYRHINIKSNTGGIWFEVTAPDGTVMEYGNGNGSRVDKSGGVDYQWSISKATDTSDDGNEISYRYYHNAAKGINYPTNIAYEGAAVDFEYRARTDASAVSIGSASQTQSVFLHTVKVSMDNTPVREYRLLDEVVSGKRRLNKIQQCGYDENGGNLECLKATDLTWATSGVSQVGIVVTKAINGLGADSRFEYGTLTSSTGSFLFTERPFGNHALSSHTRYRTVSRQVATKVRRDNGLGGFHDTRYAYQSQGVQSTKHWGFLGFFAQRIKDEQSGIVTYIQYRQDYPYFGSVARVSQYNNTYGSHTETLTRTETAYTNNYETYHGVKAYLPYANRNTSYIYESNSQIGVSETENTYSVNTPGYITQVVSTRQTGTNSRSIGGAGVWGNVPNHTVTGVANSTRATVKFTNRIPTDSPWLIGFVNEVTTKRWKGGVGTGTAITRKTTFSPDGGSLRVARFIRFPDVTALTLTTSYTYDSMGRRTKTEVSGANVALRDSQAGQNNGFDASRYPLNFTNDKDHNTTISGCDLRFGRYTNVTDANGETTASVFDNFGRRTGFTNSDNVTVTTTYTADTSFSVNGATAAYKVQTDSPVSPLSRRWYDKLGRVIRRETQSFNGTSYSRVDTWYDNQGRVKKQSLPHFTTPRYVTPSYDLRGRVTNVARPDGSSTATRYRVSGGKVVVTVTDTVKTSTGGSAGSQVKRSEYNVLGQLVKTTDAYGTPRAATVTYAYDANGNATTVTAPGGAISTMQYDAAGNRTQLIGPDVGTITTTYTALGQVKTNRDAKNQTTTFTYDTLGRLTNRSRPGAGGVGTETATWVWDTATNGKGLLTSKTNNNGFTETYTYNSDSKLSRTVTNITAIGASSGINFTTRYAYDRSGRPLTTTYPDGFAVTREYKANTGYLLKLKNGRTVLQTFGATDAFGHVTSESYGNGVATTRSYDPKTGQLTAINTNKGSTVIQDHDYAWRSNGTLESRIANPNNGISTTRKETFGYDALNRLTLAETFINGSNTRDLTYSYNSLGNITSKTSNKAGDTDVTGYRYHSTKKHAVTSATINDGSGAVGHTLSYDANGAITQYNRSGTSLDRHIQYNAANQPTKIVVGASLTASNPTAVDEFAYGPDGQRYARKTTWNEGAVTKSEHVSYIGNTTLTSYVGDANLLASYKTRVNGNIMRIKRFRRNPPYNPALPWAESTPFIISSTEYAHRDHLGSIETVTDERGNRLLQLAFEPFGSRKDSDWSKNIDATDLAAVLSNTLTSGHVRVARGFTGHEHLDKTGFIHMNGRVYDPVLGRFLSPDPIVQAPGNSQSWNRYTYVYNNPLRFTDPSGYSSEPPEEIVTTGRRIKVKDGVRVYRVGFSKPGSRIARRFTFAVVTFAEEEGSNGSESESNDEDEGGQQGQSTLSHEGLTNLFLHDAPEFNPLRNDIQNLIQDQPRFRGIVTNFVVRNHQVRVEALGIEMSFLHANMHPKTSISEMVVSDLRANAHAFVGLRRSRRQFGADLRNLHQSIGIQLDFLKAGVDLTGEPCLGR